MFQEIKVAQAAGVDLTSTRKLKTRICAAPRLLGFSILSCLIFDIQGGNFCCPNFTLMLLNNWANKHCHRRLMGCFFSFFFFGRMMLEVAHEMFFRGTKAPLSETWSEPPESHWGFIQLFERAAGFHIVSPRVAGRELGTGFSLNLLLSIDYLCSEEGEAPVFDTGPNVITIQLSPKQENVLTCWWGCWEISPAALTHPSHIRDPKD